MYLIKSIKPKSSARVFEKMTIKQKKRGRERHLREMRQHEKIHTQYKDCGHVCTKAVNIKTQTQASTHAHTNVRTLAHTH